MDLEEDFWQTVNETIETLKRREVPAQTWTPEGGPDIVGWSIYSTPQQSKLDGSPTSGAYWRESSWSYTNILATDGKLWEYGKQWTEGSSIEGTEFYSSAREVPRGYLVGSSGKPFSQYKAKLERLAYL